MTISKAARVASLMAGVAMLAAPAVAQQTNRTTQPSRTGSQTAQPPAAGAQAAQPNYNLSRPERAALAPLLAANTAANDARAANQTPNWAAVQALLPAAKAAARGQDARYLVGRVELSVALGTNDLAAQERLLTELLANPSTPPAEATSFRAAQSNIVNRRAEAAFNANDFATAERLYTQLLQANPGDTRLQTNLRIVQERQGNTAGALQGLDQQIRTAEASGGRAAEDLYQRAWQVSYRAGQRPQALAGLQRLVSAYPTAQNWRTAMDFLREGRNEDVQQLIDVYRLGRTVNVLQPREYAPVATTLVQASLFAEAKAVLDAGIAARAITAGDPAVAQLTRTIDGRLAQDRAGLDAEVRQARGAGTARQARNVADALFGYGRYAEAAEIYRVALTKGGEDANLLNTRLGVALALAGQRPAAETALRAVTGQRAELAAMWLAWLNRRQG